MNFELWRLELRRIGWGAWFAPLGAITALGALAFLANVMGMGSQTNSILSEGLDALPLVGGIAAATLLASDPALELQLTLPTSFRATALRRAALALTWTGLVALVYTALLAATQRLIWPVSPFANQLIWLVPLLCFAGIGAVFNLGMRAAAAGSGVTGVIWIFQLFFQRSLSETPTTQPIALFLRFDPALASVWIVNRMALGALAIVLFALAIHWLDDAERLLKGENG